MTGTPEDAEAAWAKCGHLLDSPDGCSECPNPEPAELAWQAWLNSPDQEFKTNHDRASFLAGYAARPSVTVDEITGLLEAHGPRENYDDDGEYIGYICQCRTKESGPYDTDYLRHAASVIVAHINGETT